jgi:acyl-CoA synthetase (AMP-forming)/AMP-acid ligase II
MTTPPLPLPTLLERLHHHTLATPTKTVYTFLKDVGPPPPHPTAAAPSTSPTATYTYQELDDHTDHLARALLGPAAQGGWSVRPGERVLLVYTPSLDFIVAYVACLKAGVVAVPVFPPIPGQLKKDLHHFASIHASSGATVALTNTAYNFAKRMDGLKRMFSTGKIKWPTNIRWIVTDKTLPNAFKLSKVLLPEPDRNALAFLQYTSGSTSDPKGVMVSHANLAHNLNTICAALKVSERTVCCAW